MLEKIKPYWAAILAVVLPLFGYLFFSRKQDNSKDAVLEYQQKEKEASITKQKEEIDQLRKEHEEATKDDQELSAAEREQFWKDRESKR